MRPHRRRGDYLEVDVAVPETASPSWNQAVEGFLRDARSRNCSPATIDNYRTYLLGPRAEQFLPTTGSTRPRTSPAGSSANSRRSCTKPACRRDRGDIPSGHAELPRLLPPRGLGRHRRDARGGAAAVAAVEPETYSEAEEQRILDAARTGRDRFLVEFMLRTGLRRTEVAASRSTTSSPAPKASYLAFAEGSKIGSFRWTRARHRFSRTLAEYLRNDRPADAQDRHLFLTTRRDPVTGDSDRWNRRASR